MKPRASYQRPSDWAWDLGDKFVQLQESYVRMAAHSMSSEHIAFEIGYDAGLSNDADTITTARRLLFDGIGPRYWEQNDGKVAP